MILSGATCLLAAAWEVIPCWGGGYVQGAALCPSDPQRLYTYVDVGGPYRSDDAGATWRPLHAKMSVEMRERGMDQVRSMSVDPRNADSFVILAGGGADNLGGFAYTRDGGNSWTVAQTAHVYGNGSRRVEGFCLTRDPFNPDNLAGGEDLDGVWISHDNGVSWRSTGPTNMWYTDIRYDATVTNRLYAASPYINPETLKTWWCAGESRLRPRGQGFFRSDDGGETWRKLSDDSPSEIAQIPGDRRIVGIFGHERIRVSADGGETWSPFEDGLYVNPGGPKDAWSGGNYYALAAGRDFWLIGDGQGTMYRRGRNETAWTKLPHGRYFAGDPENEPRLANTAPEKGGMIALMTIVTDPNDDRHWFATDWFELWETKDAGETWTTRVKNIMQLVSYDVCFDPVNSLNFCCCLYDMGLFLTFNGGNTFHRPEVRNLGSRKFPNNMAKVLYLKNRPGTVLGIGARGFDTGLWRSTTSGRVWEPVEAVGLPALVPGTSAASALVEDERDGSVLLTVSGGVGEGAGGVYRSRDGGTTWTWEGEGLSSVDSFNYGINHSQGAWPRLVRSPDGTLLTGGKEGQWLLVRDAGTNGWRKVNMWAPTWKRYPIAADPFTAKRFFRGGETDTRETTDGGVSWHKFAPLEGKACRAIAFDRHNRGLVAFGCKDGLYVSYDGGATLRRLGTGLDVPTGISRNIALDRGRLFIMTSGSGVYRFKANLAPKE